MVDLLVPQLTPGTEKLQFLVSREDFPTLKKTSLKIVSSLSITWATVLVLYRVSLNIQYWETRPYAAAGGIHDIAYKSPERPNEMRDTYIYMHPYIININIYLYMSLFIYL